MRPLVTVGVPVHNGMPYLPEVIESLLQQQEATFELLIVNDGSTDDSQAYLKAIRDPRVKVVIQSNRGLTATLNRMLLEANTPWLVRHDADDLAYPARLKHIIEHIRRHPNAGMFYSLADYNSGGVRCGQFRTTRGTPETLRGITNEGYLLSICHPAVTLNIEKAVAIGGYRFDLHVEDIDLWWRMALNHDIYLIPDVDVGVRHGHNSVSARHFKAQVSNTLYVQYLLLSALFHRVPLTYDVVMPSLESLVDVSTLEFRARIRAANSCLATRNYWSALNYSLRAFLASPHAFCRRVVYEFSQPGMVRAGENPEMFERIRSIIWPAL